MASSYRKDTRSTKRNYRYADGGVDDDEFVDGRETFAAEAKLKKMEEKGKEETRSFYDVLEVDRNASMKEIRTAYKAKARAFHPDKHSNASKEVLVEMEGKMKEVASAYRYK